MRTPALLVLVLAAIAPLAAYGGPEPDAPDAGTEYNLTAAGATFPFPLIDKWRVEYNAIYDNVNLNYQSIGSGGGIKQHIEGTVNFAASDKPMSESERALAPGTLHIPESIGGVVLVYNVPEVPDSGMNLTPEAIAGIYLGDIRMWNDPAIASANPGLDLPAEQIVPARRSDGSGTTFIFTDYLSTVSPKWERDVGKDKSVPWPPEATTVAAAGNEGVAGIVKSTDYSIGYVELAYAFQTGMSYASVRNGDGTAFVEPTIESISAASSGVADSLPAPEESWVDVSLVNAPGDGSYPIASFTYLLVYDDLEPVTASIGQAAAVMHLIHWMITDGQEHAPGLLYVPLDGKVSELGRDGLARVTYGGQALWDRGDGAMGDDMRNDAVRDGSMQDGGGGGCLIATAAYGTELAPQVQLLREIRDNSLMRTDSGAAFVSGFNSIYYTFSPAVADLERESPLFRDAVRAAITPMISSLSLLGHAGMDSELEVLGYGASLILLNLAMYVGAPAALVAAARRRGVL